MRIHTSPNMHDQIQLVTYMLMHGTTSGDLIQTITTTSNEELSSSRSNNNMRNLKVTLVALHDPPADVRITIDLTGEDEEPPPPPVPAALPAVSSVRNNHIASPSLTVVSLNIHLQPSSAAPPLVTSTAHLPQATYDASSFHIHRIDLLHDPHYGHAYHYFTSILPRLRQFNAAVHRMRQDDVMRWSYLQASDADRLSLLAGMRLL